MARPWPSGQFEFKTMSHVHICSVDANLGNMDTIRLNIGSEFAWGHQ